MHWKVEYFSSIIVIYCKLSSTIVRVRDNEHSQNIIFFAENILFSRITSFHKHSRNIIFFAKLFYFRDICLYTHTQTYAKYRNLLLIIVNYCPSERQRISDLIIINAFKGWIFLRQLLSFIVNYRQLLSRWETPYIREISSFSRKLYYFREYCLYTNTQTFANIIFFAKLFYFREIHPYKHTQIFAKYHLFRENYLIFGKFFLFLRNLSLHTQTFAMYHLFREIYIIFANNVFTQTQTFAKYHIFRENYIIFAKII